MLNYVHEYLHTHVCMHMCLHAYMYFWSCIHMHSVHIVHAMSNILSIYAQFLIYCLTFKPENWVDYMCVNQTATTFDLSSNHFTI